MDYRDFLRAREIIDTLFMTVDQQDLSLSLLKVLCLMDKIKVDIHDYFIVED